MEYALKNNGQYESVEFCSQIIQTKGKSSINLMAKKDMYSKLGFCNYKTIKRNNTLTKVDLPVHCQLKLVSKQPFSYEINGDYQIPAYYDKHKICDYLYEITYGYIDYDYAYKYFKPTTSFGCSAIRNGNFFGRNFDWLYNNDVQFVVHTPSSLDHYEVLGVSGIIPGIDNKTVDDKRVIKDGVDMFKLLPFYLLDGINEKGVFCTHNVVPLDNEENPTRIVRAVKQENDRVCIPMLVRYVLDKFSNATQAVKYIKNYVTLYFSEEMIDEWKYQSHFVIGDQVNTYVLEFIGGELYIYNNVKFITNFQITNVKFDERNYILYPPTMFGVNKYGSGLERHDIINSNYSKCNTLAGMLDTLKKVRYTNITEELFWISEIVKMDDDDGEKITVDTPFHKCLNAIDSVRHKYENKDRDNPEVWITCHTSIYDINKKRLYIYNQEDYTKEYRFEL